MLGAEHKVLANCDHAWSTGPIRIGESWPGFYRSRGEVNRIWLGVGQALPGVD